MTFTDKAASFARSETEENGMPAHRNIGRRFGVAEIYPSRAHPIIKELRAERIRRELSIPQFSKIIGYDEKAISEWERGNRVPSALKLIDWCTALGFEIQILKQTTPEPHP